MTAVAPAARVQRAREELDAVRVDLARERAELERLAYRRRALVADERETEQRLAAAWKASPTARAAATYTRDTAALNAAARIAAEHTCSDRPIDDTLRLVADLTPYRVRPKGR